MTASMRIATAAQTRAELMSTWRRHRGRLILVVLLFAGGAFAGLVSPRVIGLLVDRLREGIAPGEVAPYGIVLFAAVLAQAVLTFAATRLSWRLGEDVFHRLRENLMANALALPMGIVEQAGTGELVARTERDMDEISGTVRLGLPATIVAALTVLGTIVAALLTSPLVTAVFVLAVPILVVVLRWYARRADRVYRRLSETFGPLGASIHETSSGARAVEAQSLAESRARSFDDEMRVHWSAARERIHLRSVMLPWSNLAFAIPVFAALAWGGWLVFRGEVSIGTVVTVTLYAAALAGPLEELVGWTDELQKGWVSLTRILGLSGEGDEGREGPAPRSRAVQLQDARFAYREGHEVLHGVSLTVNEGERLAIVGPSGAGKSTIARLLSGADAPASGRALLGDEDITAIPLAVRRSEIMLVSQESHIFAATIADNVRIARAGADDADVRHALTTTGAQAWVDGLPDGAETVVGVGGHVLSGAQEQQIALARIVLADPHTVILDEATSALDPAAARDLEHAFARAMAGRTVLAIAHRLHTAHDADRIAVVEDGRIVELGSHERLVEAGGVYARLWSLWRDDGVESG